MFSGEDLDRLGFILWAKTLEFSLDDISKALDSREREEAPCRYVADLNQVSEVDGKIVASQRL